ncbi:MULTISPECIES: murein L,D-transpeptidase family protein [Emticicia]|uniref:L,D-transpeptidase family protein n=1 Tax=Emticicia TaxID=312278 RepID=UPI0007D8C48B|nr:MULTISPECIES: L,D-transpeptidase family protein [Emticicia]
MKRTFTMILLTSMLMSMTPPTNFFEQQLKFPRVQAANREKGKAVSDLLSSKSINSSNFDLFLRAFKKEQKLEVWAKNKSDDTFTLLKTYEFCATTGVLGPKRRSGDRQIPEGFYEVDLFNPQSQYLLSFRINYPNKSDLVFADKLNPGDNIFIHGHCVTIGCIPIGDENIQELYLIAAKAKSAGGKINVHIFPTIMNEQNYKAINNEFGTDASLLAFWSWLKPGFDAFENSKKLPLVSIEESGKYIVK